MDYYSPPDGAERALRSRIRRCYIALADLQSAVEYLSDSTAHLNGDYAVEDVKQMHEMYREAARSLTDVADLSVFDKERGIQRAQERLLASPDKADGICRSIKYVHDGAKTVIRNIEREFELDIDGHELVGFIDAVYRTPDDGLLVIDYKATERHRDLEDDKQLPIYLLACCDLYDEPVARAGYAYVGDIGPKIESRTFSDADLEAVRDDVTESMNRIAEFSFSRYSAGDHCQWCQHNQLPCAPDSFTVGPGFEE